MFKGNILTDPLSLIFNQSWLFPHRKAFFYLHLPRVMLTHGRPWPSCQIYWSPTTQSLSVLITDNTPQQHCFPTTQHHHGDHFTVRARDYFSANLTLSTWFWPTCQTMRYTVSAMHTHEKTLKLFNDLRYDLCFKCLVVVGVISKSNTHTEQKWMKALESAIHSWTRCSLSGFLKGNVKQVNTQSVQWFWLPQSVYQCAFPVVKLSWYGCVRTL